MNDRTRAVPQWVWVVASIVLIGGLALVTCAVGVGVLAPRAARTRAAKSADPVAASDDDFVMVHADRTQAPDDIFAAAAVSAAARSCAVRLCDRDVVRACKKLNASLSDPRMKDAFRARTS
jgi:hypothetical protein